MKARRTLGPYLGRFLATWGGNVDLSVYACKQGNQVQGLIPLEGARWFKYPDDMGEAANTGALLDFKHYASIKPQPTLRSNAAHSGRAQLSMGLGAAGRPRGSGDLGLGHARSSARLTLGGNLPWTPPWSRGAATISGRPACHASAWSYALYAPDKQLSRCRCANDVTGPGKVEDLVRYSAHVVKPAGIRSSGGRAPRLSGFVGKC